MLVSGQRVTLPGIGTFMPVGRSASFDGDVLSAPCASVAFEASVYATADSSVADSIMRREGMDAEACADIVAQECASVRKRLDHGESVALGNAGDLSAARSGSEFTPGGIFATNGWLRPLDLKPLEVRRASEAEIAKATEALEERRSSLIRSLSRTASSAAAIAVLALITFIWAQLPGRSQRQPQTASFGIESIAPREAEPLIVTPGATEPALVLILNTPADGVAPAKQRRDKTQAEAGRYVMVVASLASQAEAEEFVAQRSTADFPLGILPTQGRWRVYALTGETIDAISAEARDRDIYSAYPSAWVCRR